MRCCESYLSCVFFVTKISLPSLYRMAACIITVSQDGTADFLTVQAAIDAVPLGNIRRTVIRVSPGIYRQPVYIPKTKNFITLAALSPEDTVLTWNNTVSGINHHQVRIFSSLRHFPQMGLWACIKIVHIYDIIIRLGYWVFVKIVNLFWSFLNSNGLVKIVHFYFLFFIIWISGYVSDFSVGIFSACEDNRNWDLRLWKYHCGRGGLYCWEYYFWEFCP